jgi:hypothetical protein
MSSEEFLCPRIQRGSTGMRAGIGHWLILRTQVTTPRALRWRPRSTSAISIDPGARERPTCVFGNASQLTEEGAVDNMAAGTLERCELTRIVVEARGKPDWMHAI